MKLGAEYAEFGGKYLFVLPWTENTLSAQIWSKK